MLHKELEGAGQKRKNEKAIEKRKKEAAQWQWRENVIVRHVGRMFSRLHLYWPIFHRSDPFHPNFINILDLG